MSTHLCTTISMDHFPGRSPFEDQKFGSKTDKPLEVMHQSQLPSAEGKSMIPDLESPFATGEKKRERDAMTDAFFKELKHVKITQDIEAETNKIIDIIKNQYTVYDIYDDQKFPESKLFDGLFRNGIDENFFSFVPEDVCRGIINSRLKFFPTPHTSAIFQKCLDEDSRKQVYISSLGGIGKTYSLFLFVLLMRCTKNTRVLYLYGNSFVHNPFLVLLAAYQETFREDLEDSELSESFKKCKQADFKDNKSEAFKDFFNIAATKVRSQRMRLFIVIDAANVINDYFKKTNQNPVVDLLYNFFANFPNLTKVIIMSSATNDEFGQIEKHDPAWQFEPEDALRAIMIEKFIRFTLEGVYTLDGNIITMIRELTGDNLKIINNLRRQADCSGLKLKPDLDVYKDVLKDTLKSDMEKFFKEGDEEVRRNKKINMTQFLLAYSRQEPIPSTLRKCFLDRRYIYYKYSAAKILYPLVEETMRELLFQNTFLTSL